MSHDDGGPMADLSPTDDETGRGISPWLVVGALVLFLALLVLVPMLVL